MTTKRTNRKFKARRVSHVLGKGKGVASINRRNKNKNDSINLEQLESRQLMAAVNVADFGAKVNDGQDDRGAIQAAINAAKAGDTVQFAAGQYNVNGKIDVTGGKSLKGAANRASKIAFSTGNSEFAINLSNSSNITIEGLTLSTNAGLIVSHGKTTNVSILNNAMTWGKSGTNFTEIAFRGYAGNENLKIERNYFHDSPTSDRTIDLWDTKNTSYSHNTLYNVFDGGHIDGMHHGLRVLGNHMKRIRRMGLELQNNRNFQPGNAGNDIIIADNVLTEWERPWYDSFGLSLMLQNATNQVIRNNYVSAFAYGATGPSGGYDAGHNPRRMGYGIEVGFGPNSICENNTIVGPWVSAITCSMPNTQLKNNKHYGNSAWGSYSTEPGNNELGHGTIKDLGGNVTLAQSAAPAPPAFGTTGQTGGDTGGDTGGNTGGDTGQPIGVVNVKPTVISDNTVKLTWQNVGLKIRSIRIEVTATNSGQKFKSFVINGAKTSAFVTPVHPGWHLNFKVIAITTSGNEVASQAVTVKMTGDPNAPFDEGVFGSTPKKNKRYLEHMRIARSNNKLGDPEINQSVGGAGDTDGSDLTIRGRAFERGLGVTAASKVVYSLGGRYKTFASFVGMDDATETGATVTFQVWGDGVKLYDSGTVNSMSRARKCAINVQGVNQLWLVVTPAVGGVANKLVHADWAQSYLLAA